jgi:hypothetical protein
MKSTIPTIRHGLLLMAFLWMAIQLKAETLPGEDSAPASLKMAGKRAYAALRRRNMDVILSMLSKHGVLVTARRAVWPEVEKHDERKTPNDSFPLLLDDLSPLVWEDREVQFDTNEADDAAKLKVALARFAHEMDSMYGGLDISLHQMDVWEVRDMGPSVEGKMASNYFWYIQFRKEGKHWKIWRLELAEH